MIAAALWITRDRMGWILAQIDSSLGQVSAEACGVFAVPEGHEASGREVEEAYVETFDQKRRCCLSGPTLRVIRQRGIACDHCSRPHVRRWRCENDQLPDYLPNTFWSWRR